MPLAFTPLQENIQEVPYDLSALPANLLVFSHLRWDFVFQRPQHLLTRFEKNFNVFFMEEPVFDATEEDHYSFSSRGKNISIIVPHLMAGLDQIETIKRQAIMLDSYLANKALSDFTFWYYTPMALEFSRHLKPKLVVFDCMDELSAFKFAPDSLIELEKELFAIADVVFTGGQSLYEAKKHQHLNIHPFPSSIDRKHFLKARVLRNVSREIKRAFVKVGFFGVIDERFDIELIRKIAVKRPLWQVELVGPVVKIDPASLPVLPNINYAGAQSYDDLPAFLAGWDAALIPFLLNESTRFISPTKTPEYLAGGLPVISTPISDIINSYGKNGLVHIGSSADEFITAIEMELQLNLSEKEIAIKKADAFLALSSWDLTCLQMLEKAAATLIKSSPLTSLTKSYV